MDYSTDLLTHGVNVVTAEYAGDTAGLAVAWATQVSSEKVLICVGSQSATRPLIEESGAFGLSVLRADQLDVARTFGRHHSDEVSKFAGVACHTRETGAPLLDDCVAAFDCRVERTFDLESGQILFLARIVDGEVFEPDAERLIYRAEDY
ncbi:MAG: flavin reductase family protein [Candidatus Brocadiia bacterium]